VVTDYGATGNGITDDTEAVQAALSEAAAVGGTVYFPPGVYSLSSTAGSLSVSGDITVLAYGATLRLRQSTAYALIINTAPINLRWFGGTVDGNSLTTVPEFLFGFGSLAGGAAALLSCVAENITFINMYGGAWWANNPANTHVRWRNLHRASTPTSAGVDMFELTGKTLDADVTGTSGSGGEGVLSSALAINARLKARNIDANGNLVLGSSLPNAGGSLGLQSYSSVGAAPYFVDVELDGNGGITLENGNLSANTVVGQRITIKCEHVAGLTIGSANLAEFDQVSVSGSIDVLSSNAQQIRVLNCREVDFDIVIDGSNLSAGTILAPVLLDAGSANIDFITFKRLHAKNFVSGRSYSLISFNLSATNTVPHLTIQSGSIADNFAYNAGAGLIALRGGAITNLTVRNVAGFNPAGALSPVFPAVTFALPASGTAWVNNMGVDGTLYCTGAGTVTAVKVNNVTVQASLAVGETFRVLSGGSATFTYSAAPTLVFVGD
jgi:Pectate lyase superfamily protein